MTIRDVAAYLKFSTASIYPLRVAQRGDIPAFRIGTRIWRFKKEDLDQWLQQKSQTPIAITAPDAPPSGPLR
jgi:excisionase family DNA binding protein